MNCTHFSKVILKPFLWDLGIKLNEHGIPEDEENFEEALRAVNYAVLPTTISTNVKEILNDNACINITSKVIDVYSC